MNGEDLASDSVSTETSHLSAEALHAMANELCRAGVKSYLAGAHAEAVSLWLKALDTVPDFSAAILNLGGAYKDQGDLEQAAAHFLKALTLQPDLVEASFNLAVTCHLQGNLGAALTYYLQTIRIKPDFAVAHTNLDCLHDTVNDPNLALACFQRIREENPCIDDVGPKRIRIETSSVCNLRCQHCPTGTNYGGTDRKIMDMAMFDTLLHQMQALPILREVVFYLGGEPLLNKNLPLMCRRVKEETGVTLTQFNTNGMLITEEICRQLAEAQVDKIQVSIDGASPEENDEIRRGSRYGTIVDNVHMLVRYLPHTLVVIANTIIKRPGDPDVPVSPDFIRRDFPGLPIGTTYALKWPSLDTKRSALAQDGCEAGGAVDNFCRMPFTEMAVRPNGDVVMCCYDLAGEMVMGNVREAPLLEIWRSLPYQEIRTNMLSRTIQLLPDVCQRCQHYRGAIPLVRK